MRIKSQLLIAYVCRLSLRSLRWGLSLHGSLGKAWHALGTELLISKVEL